MTLLNLIFAGSAGLLALATMVAVVEDWYNEYRTYQIQSKVWDAAFTLNDLEEADARNIDANLSQIEEAWKAAEASLRKNREYEQIVSDINAHLQERNLVKKNLQLFVGGNINPVIQEIEYQKSLIQADENSDSNREKLTALETELEGLLARQRQMTNRIAELNTSVDKLKIRRKELEAPALALEEQVKKLRAAREKAQAHLAEVSPNLIGRIGELARDAPLLTWMNPDIKVKQTLPLGIKTDYNLLTGRTIDRCQSCHINIDDPRFAESDMLAFLERKIADDLGENVIEMGDQKPVVLLSFWENAIRRFAETRVDGEPMMAMQNASREATRAYNRLLASADEKHLVRRAFSAAHADSKSGASGGSPKIASGDDLHDMFSLVQPMQRKGDWKDWYAPLSAYEVALRTALVDLSTKEEKRALLDVYRNLLVSKYNERAGEYGRKKLSASRAQLAHPNLDLIAHPDSIHSVAKMGCTVCHGGSGEETQFKHTAHAPSNIWVDAESGMLIPDYLIESEGSELDVIRKLESLEAADSADAFRSGRHLTSSDDEAISGSGEGSSAIIRMGFTESDTREGADFDSESEEHVTPDGLRARTHTSFNEEYWYSNPEIVGDPFGPSDGEPTENAAYFNPVTGKPAHAVKQQERWEEAYGWDPIPFAEWEKPMHELRFIESSCFTCHTNIMDIDRDARSLARGRTLFAQVGCVDCHPVDSLGSPVRGIASKPDVRQIGPNLSHVRSKLSEDMIASWIFVPKAFRPSTRMPHIWLGENGSTPIDIRRSRAEVQAVAHYLATVPEDPTKPKYNPEPIPNDLVGSASNGRTLFTSVGCLGCHANVNERGLEWVTDDVMKRFGLDKDGALTRISEDAEWIEKNPERGASDANVGFFELDGSGRPTGKIRPDQYTRLQWYLMAFEPERYTRFGPELSAVGTKLTEGRTVDQARGWLYDWLRNPTHYSDYTRMPKLRLTEQESIDLAEYLLTQKHPTYKAAKFTLDEYMIDSLLINMQKNAISEEAARAKVAAMSLEQKEMDLGQRIIQFQGCFGCHEVPGFESGAAVSANLSKWGARDPHKLDFGYFDHVYDDTRPPTVDVWTTYKGGAFEGAVNLNEHSIGPKGLVKKTLPWEHVRIDRRGYLETKLFNPRVFDRNRTSREGAMTEDGRVLFTDVETRTLRLVQEGERFLDSETLADSGLAGKQVEILDVGDPYSKLRMPQFFLKKSEAEALVTYVTSLFPPLVDAELQNTTDELGTMRANGKLMAISQNCYGCHNVENNRPTIAQYYEIKKPDGSVNYTATEESMVNAPPRIVGNGAKTRHDWFFSFLGDIEMLRPWLKVRMPSFNLTDEEKQEIVGFLAGATEDDAKRIARHLKPVDVEAWSTYFRTYDKAFTSAESGGQMPAQADTLAKAAATKAVGDLLLAGNKKKDREAMTDLVREYGLYAPSQTPNSSMKPNDLALALGRSYYDLRFLRDSYSAVDYPFMNLPDGRNVSDLDFARGKKIVEDLQCFKCHALGDWGKLERIFRIEQEELSALMGPDEGADESGDEYGDEGGDGYGDDNADTQDEGYDDEGGGYGDEEDEYGSGDEGGGTPTEQPSPTLYDNLTAPNFRVAIQRLQADYIKRWLRKPQSLMPGTKMPNHWGPDGTLSAFAAFPEPMRSEKEALYGTTATEQMDLIVNFLMASLSRDYTYNQEKLEESGADASGANSSDPELDATLAELMKSNLDKIKTKKREADMQGSGEETANASSEAAETTPAIPDNKVPTKEPKKKTIAYMNAQDSAADQSEQFAKVESASFEDGLGRIAGFALFTAEPKPPGKLRIIPECRQIHEQSGTTPYRQDVLINENRTLRNVVVRLVNAPEGSSEAETDHLIDQIGCEYIPHVILLTAGDKVTFHNGDPFTHNLNLRAEKNQGFNLGQPVKGMEHTATFSQPEESIRLKCDVHSWMSAYLYVFGNPFHDVTPVNGLFEIENVPSGDYELEFIHEKFGSRKVQVHVEAGKTSRADCEYPN